MHTEHLPSLGPSQILAFIREIGPDELLWDNHQQHLRGQHNRSSRLQVSSFLIQKLGVKICMLAGFMKDIIAAFFFHLAHPAVQLETVSHPQLLLVVCIWHKNHSYLFELTNMFKITLRAKYYIWYVPTTGQLILHLINKLVVYII